MQQVDTCINCGRASDGAAQKFCPNCGQPTPARRIDWKFLAHELEHSVLHMDRGVLYTLKNLVLRPGHLMRDYLQGQRVNHVKPFLLLLMMVSLLVVVNKYLLGNTMFEMQELADVGEKDNQAAMVEFYVEKMQHWIGSNLSLFMLFMVPLVAAMYRLTFKSWREVNYPEWLVIVAFLTSQSALITLLFSLLNLWLPYASASMFFLIPLAWTLSLVQFFSSRPRWVVILRSLLGYLLYYLLSFVLMLLAVVLIVIWMGARHAAGAG